MRPSILSTVRSEMLNNRVDKLIDELSKLIGDLQVDASNDRRRIAGLERKVEELGGWKQLAEVLKPDFDLGA